MPNFKTCKNGHNYDAGLYPECPFCPANTPDTDYEQTLMDFKKTQTFDAGSTTQLDRTMIDEEHADFSVTAPGTNIATEHPFSRTTIITGDESGTPVSIEGKQKRKLVGWLITFSHDEYGQDYRIFVGKNNIGSTSGKDIVIADSSISADHATILFRDNELLIKDNFSTNGTKINGTSVTEGKLRDGDEVRFGNTVCKLKTIF